MNKLRLLFLGVIARFVNFFIPVKKKYWVLGADYGRSYREGSKYLIEYMHKHHPDYECVFITSSRSVINQVRNKGIKCYSNYSLRGIYAISKAECVFTTQYISDVLFVYKKSNRKFYYLLHGMPYKLAADALPDNILAKPTLFNKINAAIAKIFLIGYEIYDVSFISVTSDFLVEYERKDMSNRIPVKVLGMPRNDALFDDERMRGEKWLDGVKDKFVVTYMPTHRKYGAGELSPTPFIDREDYQEWMRQNGVVLLVKQHPNMIPKLAGVRQTDVIRDITCDRLDPQVCIYHSNVLITDYSSVWMDYLLLRRPVLFYIYDNFEQEDAGCHYDIRKDPPGYFCSKEDELFNLIRNCKENYDKMKPSDSIVSKYHKYVDGKSCERYFNEITSENNERTI